MTRRSVNILFSLALIAASAVFIWIALGFKNPSALSGAQVPTQAFPILVLGLVAACSALNIVDFLRGDPEGDADAVLVVDAGLLARVVSVVAIMVLAYVAWEWVGFIPTAIAMPIAIAWVMGVRSPLTYAGLVVYGPIVWAVFDHGLGLSL